MAKDKSCFQVFISHTSTDTWVAKQIACILYGLTKSELMTNEGPPIFIKRTVIEDINQIGNYFKQLKKRIKAMRKTK